VCVTDTCTKDHLENWYTHDIWNILDTAALLASFAAGVARVLLLAGVAILSPWSTADVLMYAIVLGFLRIMTVLQVFEFSGSQILIYYTIIILVMFVSSKPNYT
jgi:hypothetical protein